MTWDCKFQVTWRQVNLLSWSRFDARICAKTGSKISHLILDGNRGNVEVQATLLLMDSVPMNFCLEAAIRTAAVRIVMRALIGTAGLRIVLDGFLIRTSVKTAFCCKGSCDINQVLQLVVCRSANKPMNDGNTQSGCANNKELHTDKLFAQRWCE